MGLPEKKGQEYIFEGRIRGNMTDIQLRVTASR